MARIVEIYEPNGDQLELVCVIDDKRRCVGELRGAVLEALDRHEDWPREGEEMLALVARSWDTGYTLTRTREGRISDANPKLKL